MSLDLLSTEPEPAPKEFIRGQTLEFVMELPKNIPAGFFGHGDFHARAAFVFELLVPIEEWTLSQPEFAVSIRYPGWSPNTITSEWDTDLATTIANLATLVNAYIQGTVALEEPFADMLLMATAVDNKLILTADKQGTDLHNIWIRPVQLESTLARNCLFYGGTGRRSKASFILIDDAEGEGVFIEGTTATLTVNGHEASFERTEGMSLANAAAGLAAAAMSVPQIKALVSIASSSNRLTLRAAFDGLTGDDITFLLSSDSGSFDVQNTMYGGVDGVEDTTSVETELAAKLRLSQQSGANGFVANLNPTWEDGSECTQIRFLAEDTDTWPVGPAEFDVLFNRVRVNADDVSIYSWDNALKQVTVETATIPEVDQRIRDSEGAYCKIISIPFSPLFITGIDKWRITLEVDTGTFTEDNTTVIGYTKKYRSFPVKINITDGVT